MLNLFCLNYVGGKYCSVSSRLESMWRGTVWKRIEVKDETRLRTIIIVEKVGIARLHYKPLKGKYNFGRWPNRVRSIFITC